MTNSDGFAAVWARFVLSEVPFQAHVSRIQPGEHREVTEAGILKLKKSLLVCPSSSHPFNFTQAASNDPTAPNSDYANLRTGYKSDEYLVLMPKSWVSAGLALSFHLSSLICLLVLKGTFTAKRNTLDPKAVWKRKPTSADLTERFKEQRLSQTPMMVCPLLKLF